MYSSYKMGSVSYDVLGYLGELGVTDPEKVVSRTGPHALSHCSKSEDSLSLGLDCSRCLVAKESIDLSSVGTLFSVTESPVMAFPGNSALIASALGLESSTTLYDLNAGCTGFVDALSLSMKMQAPSLIVCAETYSKYSDFENRATRCLFSDAASATFVDPRVYTVCFERSAYVSNTSTHICRQHMGSLEMNGAEVYQFANSVVIPMIIQAVESLSALGKRGLLFSHQGSKLITDTISSALRHYDIKVPQNVSSRGNSVSATIPILMCDSGSSRLELNRDSYVLFVGFGVGLSCHIVALERNHDV
jgi:3-oxoacyl-[acyl-carrier-protein] synthase III